MTTDVPTLIEHDLRRILRPIGHMASAELVVGGMFAVTYRAVLADGTRIIIKTAPADAGRLLTYERELIRTEAMVYSLAADHPEMLMPRVLLTDFTHNILPTDVLVVTHLEGTVLLGLTTAGGLLAADQPQIQYDLGVVMSNIHKITGSEFGYPSHSPGLIASTWPEAFGLMVNALLIDAERWQADVCSTEIRAAIERHRATLDEVTVPVLAHTDLWPGNLFVNADTGRLTGVIDPERAVWGDPLLDIAGADPTGRRPVSAALSAGYESHGGRLLVGTLAGATRLLLYRMYFALVQLVEIAPRGYQGNWVLEHRAGVEKSLRATLNALS